MAFSRNHAALADGTFSATGKTNWEAGHALSGATVGGIPYFPTATSEATSANFLYTETSGPMLQVGSGSTTSIGWQIGYGQFSGLAALYVTGITPSTTNYAFCAIGGETRVNASAKIALMFSNSEKWKITSTAGEGTTTTAGIATTDVQALSVTQTLNAGGVTFTHEKHTITNTASAAGSKLFDYIVGSTSTISGTVAGKLDAVSYSVGGAAGADFGPGLPTSITVVKGIITAIS